MSFDPKKIRVRTARRAKEIDSVKIFESMTLRGSIENLWIPQAQALQAWHACRADPDVVIEMNTGGGKTLVGLLAAQSLVNETGKHVLFVCPTRQLVEQAAFKAAECGIEVATYFSRTPTDRATWDSKEIADEGRGPCVTNYAAVFNGKSIFSRFDIGGLVFDDAHVAGSIIRSCFTLTIDRAHEVFNEVIKLVRRYFERNAQGRRLDGVEAGEPNTLLYVPLFESRRLAGAISKLLRDAGCDEASPWLFPWAHIKDHLDRCVLLLSGSRLEIAPGALPLHRLPALQSTDRKVYLTATLPSPVEFVRTFGVYPEKIIRPGGKSGEAQRLFVYSEGDDDDEQVESGKELIEEYKACIITPSSTAAQEWHDVAEEFQAKKGQGAIDEFSEADDERKLILVARYDGIDLPGDACRVLVIAGLPRGSHHLSRFLDEGLQISALRASHTATRLVQAVGRIFRSNTDHGVVVLTGNDLSSWTRMPANQSHLPQLLQRQIQLGLALSESVREGETTYEDLIAAVLNGDRKWDDFYQDKINEFEAQVDAESPEWLIPLCESEQQAHAFLWEGNWSDAAQLFARIADESHSHDGRLAAWFRHWEGAAFDLGNKGIEALQAYREASKVRSELGCPEHDPRSVFVATGAPTPSSQAVAIAGLLATKKKTLRSLEDTIANMQYGPKTNPVEESLKTLGQLLGLEASRPDKDEGTGPDVKWHHLESRSGAGIEAKTNKGDKSQYQKKDDIAQFHDHANYLANTHAGEHFRKIIVGRELRVSKECHPPDDLQIIEIDHFRNLAQKVKACYEAIEGSPEGEQLPVLVQRWLDSFGLAWPDCLDSLPSVLAVDLQRPEADVDGA